MQHNIISGKISVPEEKEQQRLHRQLGEFHNGFKNQRQRTKYGKTN